MVEHIGPYLQNAQAFARLGALAGPAGLYAGSGGMIALYYDDPEATPAEQLRSEAGLIIRDGVRLPDGLQERQLPGGRYAHAVHQGPYTGLGDAWSRLLGEWLPRSGQRLAETPSYELYRNTPEDVSAAELKTDLFVPLG